jgi:hypothetical protein
VQEDDEFIVDNEKSNKPNDEVRQLKNNLLDYSIVTSKKII